MCMSVQESPMECWSVVACFRIWGTEYSSAWMGHFEGGHHYHHYIHHSLASGQSHAQQKIGLQIYWMCPKEASQVVWYSHLFKYFPQFVMIHTVKGFGIVNKAEVDVFLLLFWWSNGCWQFDLWFLCLTPKGRFFSIISEISPSLNIFRNLEYKRVSLSRVRKFKKDLKKCDPELVFKYSPSDRSLNAQLNQCGSYVTQKRRQAEFSCYSPKSSNE